MKTMATFPRLLNVTQLEMVTVSYQSWNPEAPSQSSNELILPRYILAEITKSFYLSVRGTASQAWSGRVSRHSGRRKGVRGQGMWGYGIREYQA